jgi:hypothetical protein
MDIKLRSNIHFTSENSFFSIFLILCCGQVRLVTGTTVRDLTCFNCLYFHKLLARNSLRTITIHSDINVKAWSLGNRDKSQKLFTFFLLQMISTIISLSIALQL